MSFKTLATAFAFLAISAVSTHTVSHQSLRVLPAVPVSYTVEIDHRTPAPVMAVETTTTTTTTEPPPPPTTAPQPVRKAPAPQQAPPVGSGSAEEAIGQYFGDVYDSAIAVARCESGLNPGSVSPGGGNWGLFQINTVHKADFEAYTGQPWDSGVLNANYNAMYARKLYNGSGWGPWTCSYAA